MMAPFSSPSRAASFPVWLNVCTETLSVIAAVGRSPARRIPDGERSSRRLSSCGTASRGWRCRCFAGTGQQEFHSGWDTGIEELIGGCLVSNAQRGGETADS